MREKINFPSIVAVDLFCGAGGLTHGLLNSGIDVRLGVDLDPACQFAYETNNNPAIFMKRSITEVTKDDLNHVFNDAPITLLAGCAPCQTFSKYNQKASSSDERWWLLSEFGRLVKETLPSLVTMENVPGLIKQDVFVKFKAQLEALGYYVSTQVVDCTQYGIAQQRQRLVLLASKFGMIDLVSSKKYKPQTVYDIIGKLSKLNAGTTDKKDPLHRSAKLSEKNQQRIKVSTPGGSWRDWPEELIAECHKKESGKTYGGVYGRMRWGAPAPTMTTQFYGFGNGRFGHPEQHRGLSLREGAMLQSFPQNYQFLDPTIPFSISSVGRMIGNAVPVRLGEVIGESLIAHVNLFSKKVLKINSVFIH